LARRKDSFRKAVSRSFDPGIPGRPRLLLVLKNGSQLRITTRYILIKMFITSVREDRQEVNNYMIKKEVQQSGIKDVLGRVPTEF
jgi:hypothetical protein